MKCCERIISDICYFCRRVTECFAGNYQTSPVHQNKIMCRSGGYAHKDNIQNSWVIMIVFGIIFGKIISDVISDVIDIFDSLSIISFFSIVGIIIAIGCFIHFVIRGFISDVINDVISDFIVVVVVVFAIDVSAFVVVNLIDLATGDISTFAIGDISAFATGDISAFATGKVITVAIGDVITVATGKVITVTTGDVITVATDDVIKGKLLMWGLIITLIVTLFLAIPKVIRYDKWRLGYLGELAVADELCKVGCQQWRIFHGLKIVDSNDDIDHIIVCKKGVFCVETKTVHKEKKPKQIKKIVFDGTKIYIGEPKNILLEPNQIKQIKDSAKRLCKYINDSKEFNGEELKLVIPIITFPGWLVENKFDEDIAVCKPQQISNEIKSRKDILSDGEFNDICKLLEEATQIKLLDVR